MATTDTDHLPCCGMCGDVFSRDQSALHTHNARLFGERPEWKKIADKKGYVTIPTKELEGVYFTQPWDWKRYGRRIHQTTADKSSHLTGVCTIGVGTTGMNLCLPDNKEDCRMIKDPEKAEIAQKGSSSRTYVVDMSGRRPSHIPESTCLPMHERCWTLLTRIINPDLIERNLGKFRETLLENWHLEARSPERLTRCYDDEEKWMAREGADTASDGDLSLQDVASVVAEYSANWRCDDETFALRDPLNVVDIWTSIKEEEKRVSKESHSTQKSQSTRKSQRIQEKQLKQEQFEEETEPTPESPTPTPKLPYMPPELIELIIENLENSLEAQKLMWAFPSWPNRIPNSFWRTLFIRRFMLEGEVGEGIPG